MSPINQYDALAWALERCLPGTKVTIEAPIQPTEERKVFLSAVEIQLATGPVYKLADRVWSEEEVDDYIARNSQ